METSPIEKLTQLFGLALANGLCKNKSDFAEFIGMDNSSISHAFANNGKIKVENVVRRAEEALNKAGVSLTIVGDGSMQNVSGSNNSIGVPEKKFTHESEWFALVSEKDKQIDRLLTIIEKMQS